MRVLFIALLIAAASALVAGGGPEDDADDADRGQEPAGEGRRGLIMECQSFEADL